MKKYILIILLLFTINVNAETITISSNTNIKGKTISDSREQSNVLIINNGNLEIEDSKVNKEGNGTDNVIDSSNNTAILVNEKSKFNSNKLDVNTNGSFAHGIYLKDNSESIINNSTVKTNDKYSVGIINDGSKLEINNSSIETMGHDSSCLFVIDGETNINKSNIISRGVDSPLFKASSKITIKDTKLNAESSEGIIGIPGANITLNNVVLDSNNITAEQSNFKNIYLYTPVGLEGNIVFNANNSIINTKIGNTFDIVNAKVEINLENNEINNTNGVFLRSYSNPYDTDINNDIKINLNKQLIKGNMVLDKDTVLNIYLDDSEYIGSINANSIAKEVNITLTKDSKMKLTSNMYVNSLTNGDYDNNNINLNGYKLYINNEELSKDNIIHLNEKNDTVYIILGFIIGIIAGFSVIYLLRTKKNK